MATLLQKAFCVLCKRESALSFKVIFEELIELKLQLLKAFDVSIKCSKNIVVCVHRNAKVDLVPLTKTLSVFDKVSLGIHRSLHVICYLRHTEYNWQDPR